MNSKNELQEYCQKRKMSTPKYATRSIGPPHKLMWEADICIPGTTLTAKTECIYDKKINAEQASAKIVLDKIKIKSKDSKSENNSLNKKELSRKNLSTLDTKSNQYHFDNTSNIDQSFHFFPSNESEFFSDSGSLDEIINKTISTLKKEHSDKIESHKFKYKSIALIDLENVPTFKSKIRSDILCIGFHNSVHHSIPNYKSWHKCNGFNIANQLVCNKLLFLIEGGVPDLVDHFVSAFTYPLVSFIKEVNFNGTVYIVSRDHAGFCTKECLARIMEWEKISTVKIRNVGSIESIDSIDPSG